MKVAGGSGFIFCQKVTLRVFLLKPDGIFPLNTGEGVGREREVKKKKKKRLILAKVRPTCEERAGATVGVGPTVQQERRE